MTLTLKNVKTMNGREGIAFSATLYDGKSRIAEVLDDGNGGSIRVHFCSDTRDQRDADERALCEYAIANAPGHWTAEFIDTNEVYTHDNVEMGINQLFDVWESNKLSRTKVLFKDANGETYTVGIPTGATRSLVHAHLASKYPGGTVYDRDTQKWTPILDMLTR